MDDFFRSHDAGDIDRAAHLIQQADAAEKALAFGFAVALMRSEACAQAVARYRQEAGTTPDCALLAVMDSTLNGLELGSRAVDLIAIHMMDTPLAAALRTAVQHDNPGMAANLVESEVVQQISTALTSVLGQLGQYPSPDGH